MKCDPIITVVIFQLKKRGSEKGKYLYKGT